MEASQLRRISQFTRLQNRRALEKVSSVGNFFAGAITLEIDPTDQRAATAGSER